MTYKEGADHEEAVDGKDDIGAQGKCVAAFKDSLVEQDNRCFDETIDKVTNNDVREQHLDIVQRVDVLHLQMYLPF